MWWTLYTYSMLVNKAKHKKIRLFTTDDLIEICTKHRVCHFEAFGEKYYSAQH